jgi:hypothetical protein
MTTALFTFLSPFWKNPLRDNDSIALAICPLVAICVFLVATVSLLSRNKSSLALLGSIVFWAYWLFLALAFEGRWFQETGPRAASYFLCFAVPVAFAFGAGTVSHRPFVADSAATVGFLAVPWVYSNLLKGPELMNVWIIFNEPRNEHGILDSWNLIYAVLAICSVALLTTGVVAAGLRLIASKSRFRTRSWPAFVTGFIVLVVWFSRSVMPYRIPGALDYSDWPVLQILHVEKNGLQFHENCVRVWGRIDRPYSLSVTKDDRRLLTYRFQQTGSSGGQLSDSVAREFEH